MVKNILFVVFLTHLCFVIGRAVQWKLFIAQGHQWSDLPLSENFGGVCVFGVAEICSFNYHSVVSTRLS